MPRPDLPQHGIERVFRSRQFTRFARKSGISDAALCEAFKLLRNGMVDADLGGGVYKQRVARVGQGKSGGYRTIMLFQWERYCVFVQGFAKNDRPNITLRELTEHKLLAAEIQRYDEQAFHQAIRKGVLFEVSCEEGLSQ